MRVLLIGRLGTSRELVIDHAAPHPRAVCKGGRIKSRSRRDALQTEAEGNTHHTGNVSICIQAEVSRVRYRLKIRVPRLFRKVLSYLRTFLLRPRYNEGGINVHYVNGRRHHP